MRVRCLPGGMKTPNRISSGIKLRFLQRGRNLCRLSGKATHSNCIFTAQHIAAEHTSHHFCALNAERTVTVWNEILLCVRVPYTILCAYVSVRIHTSLDDVLCVFACMSEKCKKSHSVKCVILVCHQHQEIMVLDRG